jgi:hypothetical protein
LYSDASRTGFGAILGQIGADNKEYVIAYAGRALTKSEQNLGITDLEGQALVYSIKHFDFYLRNVYFEAYVDHLPLLKLLKENNLTGKYARWLAILQQYDYKLIHKAGVTHTNADALSRREYTPADDQSPTVKADLVAAVSDSTANQQTTEPQAAEYVNELDVNMQDVIRLQREDPAYNDIILYLEDNVLPADLERRRIVCMESPMYTMNDQALYRVHIREGKGGHAERTRHYRWEPALLSSQYIWRPISSANAL